MRINNSSKSAKVKSSGLCVCTGTGSTSWSMSINRLNRQDIKNIIELYIEESGIQGYRDLSEGLIDSVYENYNQRFRYQPGRYILSLFIETLHID